MRALILRDLRDKRISLISYSGAMLASMIMYASMYPSLRDSWDKLQTLYESYPKELYQAFGIEDLSLTTLEKFLGIEQFSFVWPIVALFLVVSRAGSAIAGEIERGTIGLYLAQPISRTRIFVAKYLSFLISMAIFVTASVLAIIPVGALFGTPVNAMNVVNVALLAVLFMWAVFSVSLFVSALSSERGKVYMVMGGSMVVMYVMNVVAGLKPAFGWLANYSVFHYFNAQDILSGAHIAVSSILVFGISIVLFSLLALFAFNRRDISV